MDAQSVELLDWLNGYLQLSLSKVEQCANGAVYCQILDACRPGMVAMRKVNWAARRESEALANYGVLEAALQRCATNWPLAKGVDADTLLTGAYQPNLEMLQCMRQYWAKIGPTEGYDPLKCRWGVVRLPAWARARTALGEHNGWARSAGIESCPGSRVSSRAVTPERQIVQPVASKVRFSENVSSGSGSAEASVQRKELRRLRAVARCVEKERNWYYRKLRDVEVIMQTIESPSRKDTTLPQLMGEIMGVLSSCDDDDTFKTPLKPASRDLESTPKPLRC